MRVKQRNPRRAWHPQELPKNTTSPTKPIFSQSPSDTAPINTQNTEQPPNESSETNPILNPAQCHHAMYENTTKRIEKTAIPKAVTVPETTITKNSFKKHIESMKFKKMRQMKTVKTSNIKPTHFWISSQIRIQKILRKRVYQTCNFKNNNQLQKLTNFRENNPERAEEDKSKESSESERNRKLEENPKSKRNSKRPEKSEFVRANLLKNSTFSSKDIEDRVLQMLSNPVIFSKQDTVLRKVAEVYRRHQEKNDGSEKKFIDSVYEKMCNIKQDKINELNLTIEPKVVIMTEVPTEMTIEEEKQSLSKIVETPKISRSRPSCWPLYRRETKKSNPAEQPSGSKTGLHKSPKSIRIFYEQLPLEEQAEVIKLVMRNRREITGTETLTQQKIIKSDIKLVESLCRTLLQTSDNKKLESTTLDSQTKIDDEEKFATIKGRLTTIPNKETHVLTIDEMYRRTNGWQKLNSSNMALHLRRAKIKNSGEIMRCDLLAKGISLSTVRQATYPGRIIAFSESEAFSFVKSVEFVHKESPIEDPLTADLVDSVMSFGDPSDIAIFHANCKKFRKTMAMIGTLFGSVMPPLNGHEILVSRDKALNRKMDIFSGYTHGMGIKLTKFYIQQLQVVADLLCKNERLNNQKFNIDVMYSIAVLLRVHSPMFTIQNMKQSLKTQLRKISYEEWKNEENVTEYNYH